MAETSQLAFIVWLEDIGWLIDLVVMLLVVFSVWQMQYTHRLASIMQIAGCWHLATRSALSIQTWIWPPIIGPYREPFSTTLLFGVTFVLFMLPLYYGLRWACWTLNPWIRSIYGPEQHHVG